MRSCYPASYIRGDGDITSCLTGDVTSPVTQPVILLRLSILLFYSGNHITRDECVPKCQCITGDDAFSHYNRTTGDDQVATTETISGGDHVASTKLNIPQAEFNASLAKTRTRGRPSRVGPDGCWQVGTCRRLHAHTIARRPAQTLTDIHMTYPTHTHTHTWRMAGRHVTARSHGRVWRRRRGSRPRGGHTRRQPHLG